ncbi:MAG: hypothetical protein JW827_07745, partial [Spirochaetes bacterium]|nr:hypothetical protein [Spirochaetota bacterium]
EFLEGQVPEDQKDKGDLIAHDQAILSNQNIQVTRHFRLADKYLKEKQYDQAIEEYNKILKIRSDDKARKMIEQALYLKNKDAEEKRLNEMISHGITLFSNKQYEKAKEVFNSILKTDPQNFLVIKYMDQIDSLQKQAKENQLFSEEAEKYYQEGVAFFNERIYKKAITSFQNALTLIPGYKDSEDYIEKIKKRLEEMNLAQAKEQDRLVLEYLNQGITYYFNSEYNMAISMLEKCLRIDPDNDYALQYLQKAKEALMNREEEYINEDSAYYELCAEIRRKALYFYDIGNFEESLRWWEKILNLFPSNKEATEMAIIITLKMDRKKANEFLAVHFETGKNFLKNKNYKAALKEFKMIEKIDHEYPGINEYINKAALPLEQAPVVKLKKSLLKEYYENGLKYYKQNNYDMAIAEWQKVLEDNSPENPYVVNAIVNINKARRKKTFIPAKIKEEEPKADKYTEIVKKHYLKGVAYYVKGKYQEAINEWKIVLKYEPNHYNARNNIEKCSRKIKFSQ